MKRYAFTDSVQSINDTISAAPDRGSVAKIVVCTQHSLILERANAVITVYIESLSTYSTDYRKSTLG